MILMGVELRLAGRAAAARAETFDISRVNRIASHVANDRAGKPTDRYQTKQLRFARIEIENRDRILRSIAGEELSAQFIERQRVWLRAEEIGGILPRPNRFNDLISARIKDADRIAACIRNCQPSPIR